MEIVLAFLAAFLAGFLLALLLVALIFRLMLRMLTAELEPTQARAVSEAAKRAFAANWPLHT